MQNWCLSNSYFLLHSLHFLVSTSYFQFSNPIRKINRWKQKFSDDRELAEWHEIPCQSTPLERLTRNRQPFCDTVIWWMIRKFIFQKIFLHQRSQEFRVNLSRGVDWQSISCYSASSRSSLNFRFHRFIFQIGFENWKNEVESRN